MKFVTKDLRKINISLDMLPLFIRKYEDWTWKIWIVSIQVEIKWISIRFQHFQIIRSHEMRMQKILLYQTYYSRNWKFWAFWDITAAYWQCTKVTSRTMGTSCKSKWKFQFFCDSLTVSRINKKIFFQKGFQPHFTLSLREMYFDR